MITGNELATPIDGMYASESRKAGDGLTIRQYFAAMAMQGLCTTYFKDAVVKPYLLANLSVQFADTLISELNKEQAK